MEYTLQERINKAIIQTQKEDVIPKLHNHSLSAQKQSSTQTFSVQYTNYDQRTFVADNNNNNNNLLVELNNFEDVPAPHGIYTGATNNRGSIILSNYYSGEAQNSSRTEDRGQPLPSEINKKSEKENFGSAFIENEHSINDSGNTHKKKRKKKQIILENLVPNYS